MKKISKLTVITTLITLLPIVLGIALYDRLPDVVATHWGIDNQPNGWSSKAMAAFGMPGILALINLVCSIAMEIYPDSPFVKVRPVSIKAVGGWEKENKLADKVSPRLMWLCRWIIPVLSLILVPVMLYSAMGVSFDVGIKIPWTLSSDENWDKTHRFAGFVWIVCGAAAIVGGWIKPVVAIVALVAMILLPVVYSGILKHKGI